MVRKSGDTAIPFILILSERYGLIINKSVISFDRLPENLCLRPHFHPTLPVCVLKLSEKLYFRGIPNDTNYTNLEYKVLFILDFEKSKEVFKARFLLPIAQKYLAFS